MATVMPAPVNELGYATAYSSSWWLSAEQEQTPELRWPLSIFVYDRMARQDAQVQSVLRAVTLPVRRTPWSIDPGPASDEVARFVADNLGLPVSGKPPVPSPRTRDRFSWSRHLTQALLMIRYGHMFFEQVYRIGDDGRAYLRKLAPRMPQTLMAINVDRDGGLASIQQYGTLDGSAQDVTIPVTRLVGYIHEQEGGNWLGQAMPLETLVPTPDGWRALGDLLPGSRVFDERGMIRHVVARKVWNDRPCYEVTFGDGEKLIADANHQWLTHDFAYRSRGRGTPRIVTTEEMAQTVKVGAQGISNHAIPLTGAVQYTQQHLAVDPYVLGYWLGDGCKGSGRIVTADQQVADRFAERGYPCEKGANWVVNRQWNVKGLATELRALGVIDSKRIPDHYLRGSIEQRLELLRGLMDSDGTITKEGQCVFAGTDPGLVSGVLELVRSLGVRASSSIVRQAGRTSNGPLGTITSRRDIWHVQFATHLPVFGLDRKAARLRPDNARRRYHIVKSVTPVPVRDTVCIEVDSPSHLFLVGRSFVPTHNSLLRPAYKHWLLKDRLLRVQAQTIERNGMGVPVYTATVNGEDFEAGKKLATEIRAGDTAGGAIPNGAELEMKGVTGTLPNAQTAIDYHDQQIGRSVLAHFLNLGTQTGSWALGSTFADFFSMSLQTLAQQVADITQQHVVEDLVDINFGPDEPAPRLTFQEIGSRHAVTAEAIALLVNSGVLLREPALERYIRETYGIPDKEPLPGQEPAAPTTTTPAPSGTGEGADA